MKPHHVGILVDFMNLGFVERSLVDLFSQGQTTFPKKVHYISKWKVRCHAIGMIELIEIDQYTVKSIRDFYNGIVSFTQQEQKAVLHHIAFQVNNFDWFLEKLGLITKVLYDKDVVGYTGKRIAFIHPSWLGILIEIME